MKLNRQKPRNYCCSTSLTMLRILRAIENYVFAAKISIDKSQKSRNLASLANERKCSALVVDKVKYTVLTEFKCNLMFGYKKLKYITCRNCLWVIRIRKIVSGAVKTEFKPILQLSIKYCSPNCYGWARSQHQWQLKPKVSYLHRCGTFPLTTECPLFSTMILS